MIGTNSGSAERPDDRSIHEAALALDAGDEDRAIRLFQECAAHGDLRASLSLAYILEGKGTKDRTYYIQAAHWYTNALAKEDLPEAHFGLARYYYYGLSGKYDFGRAFDHLGKLSPEKNIEVALMLGELFFFGAGVPRNLDRAKQLFTLAANAGFPYGLVGLARIENTVGNRWRSRKLKYRAMVMAAKLIWKNRKDPRLLGIGRGRGRLALDRVVNQLPQ